MCMVTVQSGSITVSHICGRMISPVGPIRSNCPSATIHPTGSTCAKAWQIRSFIPFHVLHSSNGKLNLRPRASLNFIG